MDTKFAIVSDGSCDLPAEEAAKNHIHIVPFSRLFRWTRPTKGRA